eukprot:11204725-Lingulodinium_polyedra.AAC.1
MAHKPVEGQNTRTTAYYPAPMARRVCKVLLKPEPWTEVIQQVRRADLAVAQENGEIFVAGGNGEDGEIPDERRKKIEA